jgi:hypothetical protein
MLCCPVDAGGGHGSPLALMVDDDRTPRYGMTTSASSSTPSCSCIVAIRSAAATIFPPPPTSVCICRHILPLGMPKPWRSSGRQTIKDHARFQFQHIMLLASSGANRALLERECSSSSVNRASPIRRGVLHL